MSGLGPRLVSRREFDTMMGEGAMGSPRDNGEAEQMHHGWQVEYLAGVKTDRGATCRTDHPSARSYELVSERAETTPTLALFDEEDEAIAVYNGLSWVACRRIAKPGESV